MDYFIDDMLHHPRVMDEIRRQRRHARVATFVRGALKGLALIIATVAALAFFWTAAWILHLAIPNGMSLA